MAVTSSSLNETQQHKSIREKSEEMRKGVKRKVYFGEQITKWDYLEASEFGARARTTDLVNKHHLVSRTRIKLGDKRPGKVRRRGKLGTRDESRGVDLHGYCCLLSWTALKFGRLLPGHSGVRRNIIGALQRRDQLDFTRRISYFSVL